jgi:hypothetical protein
MSKLMLMFLLFCSVTIYDPKGTIEFLAPHASQIGWQLKYALLNADQLLPNFMRFGRS